MESQPGPSRALSDESRPSKLYGSACDSCRRRRVKCDGNQPCDRCLRSDISCTYGSLSSRTSAVSYARHLEQKVSELQRLLHLQPSEDDSVSSADMITEAREAARAKMVDMLIGPGDDFVYRLPHTDSNVFYGRFGGLGTMHKIGSNIIRFAHDPSMKHFGRALAQNLETCSLTPTSPSTNRILSMLPPQSQVLSLSERAAKMALVCHECLDYQDYIHHLDRLYNTDPEDYSLSDRSFLALVYVMIALGKRFAPMSEQPEIDEHSDTVQFKGLAYFSASRATFNLVEASDLNAIRAVICQARYFSSMSMISQAYSQVCVGIAIAMRLGMHTSSQAIEAQFSKEELFERRKVFATLNMMDIYYSSTLGVPLILKDAESGQTLGLHQSDFADQGRSFIAQNAESTLVPTIMCQKINLIMAKVCESRLFIGKTPLQTIGDHHEEITDGIADREAEIEDWYQNLPALPTETLDQANLQAHLTLRLWHALVQIVLYRPFLHHLARSRDDPLFSMLGFEYASKCVQAAMQVILTIEVFRNYDALHEGFWLYIYMLEFAVSILLYFISSSPQSATVRESQIAATRARDLLGSMAKYNLSARKYFNSLNEVLQTWSPLALESSDES